MSFLDSLRSHHVKNHQVDAFFKSNKGSATPNIIVSCGSGAAEPRNHSEYPIPVKVRLAIPGKQPRKTEKTQARINALFHHIEHGDAEEAARLIKKLAPYFMEHGNSVGVAGDEKSIQYANTLHDALEDMLGKENKLLESGSKPKMQSGVYQTLTSFSRQMEPKQVARNTDARFDKQKTRFDALVKFHEGQLQLDPRLEHSATRRVAEHLRKARHDFEAAEKTVMAVRSNAGAQILKDIDGDKALSEAGKELVDSAYQSALTCVRTDKNGLPENPAQFTELVTALRKDARNNDAKLTEFAKQIELFDSWGRVDNPEKEHVVAQSLRACLVVLNEHRATSEDGEKSPLALLLDARLDTTLSSQLLTLAALHEKKVEGQPPVDQKPAAGKGRQLSQLPTHLFA